MESYVGRFQYYVPNQSRSIQDDPGLNLQWVLSLVFVTMIQGNAQYDYEFDGGAQCMVTSLAFRGSRIGRLERRLRNSLVAWTI